MDTLKKKTKESKTIMTNHAANNVNKNNNNCPLLPVSTQQKRTPSKAK